MSDSSSGASTEPLAILSSAALFERQCVLNNVSADARALRQMLRSFFDAGVQAGQRGTSPMPARHPLEADSALGAMAEAGFDPVRVMAALSPGAAPQAPGAILSPAAQRLREAAGRFIKLNGPMSSELNYRGVVDAYDELHADSAKSAVS